MLRRLHKSIRSRSAAAAGPSRRLAAATRVPSLRSRATLLAQQRREAGTARQCEVSDRSETSWRGMRFASTSTHSPTATHDRTPSLAAKKPLPSKVLIANRGEIACRVMRTCTRLGIKTVAVYSEADRFAAHVAMADEAYCIGPAQSAESYLRMDRILQVCKATGAEMVHPGYGFLSENSDFARELAAAGIKFIGPPTEAILSMGSKSASKEIMTKAGVPCVPGYHGSDQSDETLQREAAKIGYPVLIKAVKGGGGKGMKIVQHEKDFMEQLTSARREAAASFGDGDVLIERYLTKPRHVEVQIVSSGQPHNEHVAISTRDCSVQRRHQKIIEEAPAPHLSPEVEADLCAKAVAAAAAVGYEGAGTVEFILDADTGEAWFLECNTRLQVEHPVSEMVSGIDLVEWQLEAAAGNALPLKQNEIKQRGHAFEARIYAEDTRANFLPDVGHLAHVSFPMASTTLLSPPPINSDSVDAEALSSVRIDTGVATGDEVSVHYDPMIAKLIVHGRDRSDALRLMRAALAQTHIVGPQSNVAFLARLCEHEAFVNGTGLETGFIPKYKADLLPARSLDEAPPQQASIHAAIYLALTAQAIAAPTVPGPWSSPEFVSFRNTPAQPAATTYILAHRAERGAQQTSTGGERAHRAVTVTSLPYFPNRFKVDIDGSTAGTFDAALSSDAQSVALQQVPDDTSLESVDAAGRREAKVIQRPAAASALAGVEGRIDVFCPVEAGVGTQHIELDLVASKWVDEVRGNKIQAKGSVIAPMPSKVVDVRVKPGDQVKEGDIVVVLEAMKTEHTLRAPKDGVVAKITIEKGAMCAEGTELVLFEEEEEKVESP